MFQWLPLGVSTNGGGGLGGGVSSSEQVWIGLHWWPPDGSSREWGSIPLPEVGPEITEWQIPVKTLYSCNFVGGQWKYRYSGKHRIPWGVKATDHVVNTDCFTGISPATGPWALHTETTLVWCIAWFYCSIIVFQEKKPGSVSIPKSPESWCQIGLGKIKTVDGMDKRFYQCWQYVLHSVQFRGSIFLLILVHLCHYVLRRRCLNIQ